MLRRVFSALSGFSFVLCVGATVLSAASIGHLCRMTVAHVTDAPTETYGQSIIFRGYNGKLGIFAGRASVSPQMANALKHIAPNGFTWSRSEVFGGSTSDVFSNDFGIHREIVSQPSGEVVSYDCVFPAWLAIPLFAALPAIWIKLRPWRKPTL